MRKILRILFVTIFIVSTLLVLFRWEEGPEQRDKNLTLIHKKDRWTDRGWVKAYGSINGNYYSGEERPVFTEAEIEQHTEKYLSTPAFQDKKALIKMEQRDQEAINKKIEKFKEELSSILVEHKMTKEGFYEESSFDLKIRKTELALSTCNNTNIPNEIQGLIERNISQTTISDFWEFCGKHDPYTDTFQESEMTADARELAKAEMNTLELKKRKNLTYAGASVLLISALLFILSFVPRNKKKDKEVDL